MSVPYSECPTPVQCALLPEMPYLKQYLCTKLGTLICIIYFELGKHVCIFLHSFILWQVEMAKCPTPDLLTYYTGQRIQRRKCGCQCLTAKRPTPNRCALFRILALYGARRRIKSCSGWNKCKPASAHIKRAAMVFNSLGNEVFIWDVAQ